jgi:DNA-binding FadR family transcriptional regulator
MHVARRPSGARRIELTVYRRPDPIPRRRPEPVATARPLQSVRAEQDDLHHLVARKIYAAIADGHFPEGSILPNEHALGEMLGVSRTALREAIKGLSSKGMLETRRRRGTLVMDRRHWTQVDGEVINWSRKSDSLKVTEELWQALQSVMPTLAASAAAATPGRGLARPRLAGDDRVADVAEFLTDIARLSGNRFLHSMASIGLINLVEHDTQYVTRMVSAMPDGELLALHGDIVSGDAAGAAERMRALLSGNSADRKMQERTQLPA